MASSDSPSIVRGSCACGRNRYTVEIPRHTQTLGQLAHVYFDSSAANRWHLAFPLTAWLRVPLSWYQSITRPFFPDENPLAICRTFNSPFPTHHHARRTFCGYCGTPLSTWHERTRADAGFICLTLGSVLDEDVGLLEDLGLLPASDLDEDDHDTSVSKNVSGVGREGEAGNDNDHDHGHPSAGDRPGAVTHSHRTLPRGAPWFEDLVSNSRLGKLYRRKAGGGGVMSQDGDFVVRWEVSEWEAGADVDAKGDRDGDGSGDGNVETGKRKIAEVYAERSS